MKIVIELREEVYDEILNGIENAEIAGVGLSDLSIALKNGIPLPKGHGDLVDIEVLKAVLPTYVFRSEQGQFCRVRDMDNIPSFAVALEADKGVDE